MIEQNREVIVVGGGISGLTAAWHLKRAGVDVCLLEAGSEVGGVTRTEQRDGFLLEKGPFNVIVRDPTFESLLEGVADDVNVVSASKEARKRYLYRGGRLLAVPSNPVALLTTPLLGLGGKWRLMTGLLASRRSLGGEETIEQVGIRRFGREVTDTMISAVVAGIYAGDIRRLSLSACFPTIARIDREARSLIGYGLTSAFRKKKGEKRSRRRWRGLVSVEGGLGAFTGALGRSLGSDCICDCKVDEIACADDAYQITCSKGDGPPLSLRGHRLVLASSAVDAARALDPIVPEAAETLRTVESAPMVVLNLGFQRNHIAHPLEGFGFLVPHDEPDYPLLGILWADSIFPHHAPPDHRLIRVFIGGSRDPGAAERGEDELLATAMSASRDLLGLSGDPVLIDICPYKAAIPQYGLGYLEKMERLHAAMAKHPRLHLAGNYLEGVSLNDCVRCGTRVAEEIIGADHTATQPRQLEVPVAT